jgi:hypothetical protein
MPAFDCLNGHQLLYIINFFGISEAKPSVDDGVKNRKSYSRRVTRGIKK